jgi:hypothetical protein
MVAAMGAISSRPFVRAATARHLTISRCTVLACSFLCTAILSGCASVTADKSSASLVPAKISVVPAEVSFNSVVVGQKNSQAIKITNTTTAPISLQHLRASGSGFILSPVPTPLLLAPGKHTNLNIIFAPSAATQSAGSLVIYSSDLKAPITVPLSGAGEKPVATLAASPSAINFGAHAVKSSTSQSVTLKNTGNISVSLNTVALSGAVFSISGLVNGVSLSPGQALNFQVWFHPTSTGSSSTTVTLSSASLSAPVKLALSGSASATTSTSTPSSVVSHSVSLDWNPSSSTVVGYHIYRGTSSSGPFSRITGSLIGSLNYLDAGVEAGAEYFYVVTAVEASGAESAFSNVVFAAIPNP